jgi:hypothetical protein
MPTAFQCSSWKSPSCHRYVSAVFLYDLSMPESSLVLDTICMLAMYLPALLSSIQAHLQLSLRIPFTHLSVEASYLPHWPGPFAPLQLSPLAIHIDLSVFQCSFALQAPLPELTTAQTSALRRRPWPVSLDASRFQVLLPSSSAPIPWWSTDWTHVQFLSYYCEWV